MFCVKCGSTVNEGAATCDQCGNTIVPLAAPQQAYSPAASGLFGISIQRIILAVAALLGMIANFMPWISVRVSAMGYSEAETVRGSDGDGWITFILFVIILAIAVIGKWAKPLGKAKFVCAALGLVNFIVVLAVRSNVVNGMRDEVNNAGIFASAINADVSMGIGMALAIILSIVIIIASFIKK